VSNRRRRRRKRRRRRRRRIIRWRSLMSQKRTKSEVSRRGEIHLYNINILGEGGHRSSLIFVICY